MALIKSISGFRGTIGGKRGDNLTPIDIVESASAFGALIKKQHPRPKVVVGRDARISGPIVHGLVVQTLLAQGIDVVDLGLSTTPTVEMGVIWEKAQGGIIITASHNPREWNALKFLNEEGNFISPDTGQAMLYALEANEMDFAPVDQLGAYTQGAGFMEKHVAAVLAYPLVDRALVAGRKFRVVVDAINSTGALIIPMLLEQLGCEVVLLNGTPNGQFAHNPEPLPEHLTGLSEEVRLRGADLGVSVDPDVDRLALISEDGTPFGEEYTLVAVADLVLQNRPGNTVSNMSSSRALRDVTVKYGGSYFASAVGEVHVAMKMKETQAVIGGEGNGGVIVPDLHYGRDAVAGLALFLTGLARFGGKATEYRAQFPHYVMVKDKISLPPGLDLKAVLSRLETRYASEEYATLDGLKIDFPSSWVHVRGSNTEPIIRIYAEAPTPEEARDLVDKIKTQIL
ncbi:MAG: phosphoglucosamine mutase [Haliscomenobacter sp.]|nr:phosphoglucosamine mutase [Haliscomenobacter sp.]